MERPALVIMAKVPSAGGKSRLKSLLTPAQREELQWAFLGDILDKAHQIKRFTIFLALTPIEQADKVKRILDRNINIIGQPKGDLGVRMFSVANHLFEQGYGPVLITGTDIPTLSPDNLVQALQTLQSKSLVFGPTTDGGYYLVGLSYPESKVFAGIDWGTSQVLQQTVTKCQRFNLPFSLLNPLEDIDWPVDLLALQKALIHGNPNDAWFPQRTASFLIKYQFIWEDDINGSLL